MIGLASAGPGIFWEKLGLQKEPKEFALEYAGFWVRVGAGVVDVQQRRRQQRGELHHVLAQGAVQVHLAGDGYAAPGQLALGEDYCVAAVSPSSGGAGSAYSFVPVLMIGMMVSWLIGIPYFVGFWVWRGQTPGKMAMGIKVIGTDSSPITWQYALLRYFGYVVSAGIVFVGFVWIAFDSHKQGIHDKIADTYVVKLPVRQVVLTQSYARGGVG